MIEISSERVGTITTDPAEYFGIEPGEGPADLFFQVIWKYSSAKGMHLDALYHSSDGRTAIFTVDDGDDGQYLLTVVEMFFDDGEDDFWASMELAFEEA